MCSCHSRHSRSSRSSASLVGRRDSHAICDASRALCRQRQPLPLLAPLWLCRLADASRLLLLLLLEPRLPVCKRLSLYVPQPLLGVVQLLQQWP